MKRQSSKRRQASRSTGRVGLERISFVIVAELGLLFVTPILCRAAALYTITDLGTLGGTYSEALAINSSGQAVGPSYTSHNEELHAFLYSRGVMADLGTLGGTLSQAQGINAKSQIVGWSYTAGDAATHAFLYSCGGMTDLGTLGGNDSYAYGINENSHMVGYSQTASGSRHAFRTAPNSPINPDTDDLDTLGGTHSCAYGINDNGQVVGWSNTDGDSAYHAFRWSDSNGNGESDPGEMVDLETLGGTNSYAYRINARDQVVGYSQLNDGREHAFLYCGGVMTDLGTLGGAYSTARGINSSGQVVGYCYTVADEQYPAFIYSGGVMTDLNSLIDQLSGWRLCAAMDINDRGQVVGYGMIGAHPHGFLLTPVCEPSSIVLAISVSPGLLGGMRLRRRRTQDGHGT